MPLELFEDDTEPDVAEDFPVKIVEEGNISYVSVVVMVVVPYSVATEDTLEAPDEYGPGAVETVAEPVEGVETGVAAVKEVVLLLDPVLRDDRVGVGISSLQVVSDE